MVQNVLEDLEIPDLILNISSAMNEGNLRSLEDISLQIHD